jgi:hypothetical protein
MKKLLFVCCAVATVSAQTPGQVRPRPAEGREPEFKPPTIREYRPKSTLVTPQHPVPRAKFPVIDIHSHQSTPISAGEFDRVMKGMEANNLQILVNLSGSSGSRLQQGVEALRASRYKDRMVLFANINFRDSVGPGFGAKAAAQLEADVKAGAVGLKIFKDLGMFVRKADGSRLRVDDPELDVVWDTCARLEHPGPHSRRRAGGLLRAARLQQRALARAGSLSRSPPPDRRPLRGADDGAEQHDPQASEHALHPGALRAGTAATWRERASCSTRTRTCTMTSPPCSTTSAASPRRRTSSSSSTRTGFCSARTAISPTSIRTTGASSRPTTSTFDYYRDYHAFWKLYGIGLPDQVLKKLYYQNALKVTPGLPRAAFPG